MRLIQRTSLENLLPEMLRTQLPFVLLRSRLVIPQTVSLWEVVRTLRNIGKAHYFFEGSFKIRALQTSHSLF